MKDFEGDRVKLFVPKAVKNSFKFVTKNLRVFYFRYKFKKTTSKREKKRLKLHNAHSIKYRNQHGSTELLCVALKLNLSR